MPVLNPYLTFPGNCREAMTFYKEVLGGELTMIVVKDSPVASHVPADMQDQLLHSSLKTAQLELMATDMQPGPVVFGNDVHLSLGCESEEEMRSFFDKLSAGGKVEQPINEMFFGFIGSLSDKFGKHWIVVYNRQ